MGEIENRSKNKLHAIVFPLFAQGHINPCVRLAIKLASKGLTITFVHFEHVHHQIAKSVSHNSEKGPDEVDIFSGARKPGLDIRYMTISDGWPVDFDRIGNFDEYFDFIHGDFPALVDPFVGKIIESSDPSSVHFLLVDSFFSWPAAVAKKYNLVNVSFWTQPAALFAINYYKDLLRENGHFPPKGKEPDVITYIPGIDSISTKDLPSFMHEAETTAVNKVVLSSFKHIKAADFILCNTINELESHTLSVLNKNVLPAYAIGPIDFSIDFDKMNVSNSMLSETDCTEWLDSKPPGSVLYVSFGSNVLTSEELMNEIAHGIILSEVNFIWVIRPEIASSIEIPSGFKDNMKEKGLIVPWCNQKNVLSNPAIGGFLTHCGWNSILESMWCGVPMICHPVLYDQQTNRKLVVDDWKIGINLCEGGHVTREEVAISIRWLMKRETSDNIRLEMKKISSMLHDAVIEDGSSNRNFDQFLNDLWDKIHAKNGNTTSDLSQEIRP